MGKAKQYTGGCHCGRVRYEVKADLGRIISCNCSICSKKGSILAFAPRGEFCLLSGESDLADYLFNKHVINHRFCRTCGVESFAFGTRPDGQEMAAINVRCLDGVDVAALNPVPFDGRSL
jgi:hypothetical protein